MIDLRLPIAGRVCRRSPTASWTRPPGPSQLTGRDNPDRSGNEGPWYRTDRVSSIPARAEPAPANARRAGSGDRAGRRLDQADNDRTRATAGADRRCGVLPAHARARSVARAARLSRGAHTLSVAGMIVAASTTLLVGSRSGQCWALPWALLVAGSVASLAANDVGVVADALSGAEPRAPWGGDDAAGAPPLTRLAACPRAVCGRAYPTACPGRSAFQREIPIFPAESIILPEGLP